MSMPDKRKPDFVRALEDAVTALEKDLSEACLRDDFRIRNTGGGRPVLPFRASVSAPAFPDRLPGFIPPNESHAAV